ncbi:MAG: S9 family peptidase [Gemmatimonadetes bacterium]|nr:S9 family peptidase [Gemmatimonadota bacterium]NNM06264.1 S9 family peptidase [Gemmatimonadota bacterium]
MRITHPLLVVGPLLLILGIVAPNGLKGQEKTVTLEMYLDLESASNPQISPDGTEIIFTRGGVDNVNDRRYSQIWIMDVDGSRKRYLTDGSSPVWSPDGSRIAFTAQGEPRGSQVFVRWMDAEGATSQITRVDRGPGSLRWSPDGTQIAFTMAVEDAEPWTVSLPDRPRGAQWTEGPKIVDRLSYRRDRQGFVDTSHSHIFVVPADGGTPRQLSDGEWNHSGPRWSPDGSEIYFSSLREEEADWMWRESEIYAVDVETGAFRQLTSRRGPDSGPVPSPDGSLVAYQGQDWSTDTYVENGLYVMNVDGSDPRRIAGELGRSLGNVTWAPDASGVYFNAPMKGNSNVWFAPLNGEARPVTEGNHMLSFTSTDGNGSFAATISSYHEPGDIWTFNVANPSRMERLTRVNEDVLHSVTMGEVEEIWYQSTGGLDIQGWIIRPPNFDPSEKYPLILTIHGGPHSMYGVGFSHRWQNHAAEGYVVLYTNPRGSAGYGSAFGNEINNAYPDKDFDDLMNGVDEVIAKGYIDEENMFVYGGSGGGVLTAWIVGHTDRFAAASSNYPVIDWISFVGTTDGASWYRNFEKFPWEDPSEHLERSPLMYAGNVTTPTMLMTGELDLRTPISQTEEFYAALKVQKIPSVMLRFKGEYHGTSSIPSNYMRSQLYMHSWFEKWKK